MAYIDFHPTIHAMGDEACAAAIIEGTITEFEDASLDMLGTYALSDQSQLSELVLPSLTNGNTECLSSSALKTLMLHRMVFFRPWIAPKNKTLETVVAPAVREAYGRAFDGCSALKTLVLGYPKQACVFYDSTVLNGTEIANGNGYIYVWERFMEEMKNGTNSCVYAEQFRAIEDYPEIQALLKEVAPWY